MTNVHLFDNIGGAWTDPGGQGSAYSIGNRFSNSQGGYAIKLGFYRLTTGSLYGINKIRLWDSVTQTIVAEAASPTDSGVGGWQWTAITPYALVAGRMYVVVVDAANGNHTARVTRATGGTPPFPLAFDANAECLRYSAPDAYPGATNVGNTNVHGVDVEWSIDGGVSTPITQGSLNTNLGDSSVIVGIQNDLAFLKTSVQTDLAADVGVVQATVSDTAGDVSAILTSVGSGLGAAVSSLTTSIGTGLSTKVDDIKTSVGTGLKTALDSFASGWSAWRGVTDWTWDTFQAVAELEGNLLQGAGTLTGKTWVNVVGKIYSFLGNLGRETTPLGTGWTQDATTPLTGALAWNQPADLYLISFVTPPSNAVGTNVDGVEYLGHMLWWAEWDGDQAGERHFLDFPAGFCAIPGRRMAGILLKTNGPCDGTVAAWSYTAP